MAPPRITLGGWLLYGLAALLVLGAAAFSALVHEKRMPAGSMAPTIHAGDAILYLSLPLGVRPWRHGTVVVFDHPNGQDTLLLKRMVGLPGDSIELRNKQLIRNGQPVEEPYTHFTDPQVLANQRDNMPAFTVPPDSAFVLGDNRDESYDSRFFGVVPLAQVVGVVVARSAPAMRFWEWQRLHGVAP